MFLRDLYYFVKPAIPLRLRLAMKRLRADKLRKRHGATWPINEAARRVPDKWPGWPAGKRFAFVLTHDVEGIKGLNRCYDLADMENRLGFRSAFGFVPEGEYRVPDRLREFLTSNGFEVGVHDLHHDGSLYHSEQSFRAGAEKINRYIKDWGVSGFRSGYMRHNLMWLDRLNVLYDSSTFDTDPFEPQPDGVDTIFPFWVSQDGRQGYVELPYTLPQDSTLFLTLQEQSIEIWTRKLDWVVENGGMALVNIHPDYMCFNGRSRLNEYSHHRVQEFLEYVRHRHAEHGWFALPKEVAEYAYSTMVAGSGMTNRCLSAREVQSAQTVLLPSVPERQSGHDSGGQDVRETESVSSLAGKRMAVVSFSSFPGDPRPRRAAETFAQAGMAVEVICLMDEGSPKQETFKGIEIERVAIEKVRNSKFWYLVQYGLFIATAFIKLAARSISTRYHIVHIHNMPDVLVVAALVPKLLGAKVILDLHDPMPELMMTIFRVQRESWAVRFMSLCEKWSIALADVVLTVNRACEKLFVSRSCVREKICVVMNAPDETIFKYVLAKLSNDRSKGVEAPFVIMYHGTLVDRNGVDLAVDALAEVRRVVPRAELSIYGPRTPFLDRVMASVAERGLEKAVHYLGPRRLEELVEAIADCDVGVIPNKRSIFTEINTPTRIFEYLALGKPVVAPRAPGIQDYFTEDELIYFDLGSVKDLARALAWAATHPEKVFEKTSRGQAVYRAHSWQVEQAKLLAVGKKLIALDRDCVLPESSYNGKLSGG